VGTYGSDVRGFDWEKGETLWSYKDTDREFPYLASAALAEDRIIIGGRDKRLRALSTADGKELWLLNTRGRIDSSAVIVGDRAFVGSGDGKLYAVRVSDGEVEWSFEAGEGISASPAVAAGRLVIGTLDGVLYCFGD